MTIYICKGEEEEIKKWFETINIAGEPLNDQELLNALNSGPFVTAAKKEFSNSNNANVQKWNTYIKGDVKRQAILEQALNWVSNGNISRYMNQHRGDTNINELKNYFDSVISWIETTFDGFADSSMCGLEWGRLYRTYHDRPYSPTVVSQKVRQLLADTQVKDSGIYEFILGGEQDYKLLHIRVFDPKTARRVYDKQTSEARITHKSNCPLCAISNNSSQQVKIYDLKDMEADHVTAWINGGETDERNCQMLCKTHNRAKGNNP